MVRDSNPPDSDPGAREGTPTCEGIWKESSDSWSILSQGSNSSDIEGGDHNRINLRTLRSDSTPFSEPIWPARKTHSSSINSDSDFQVEAWSYATSASASSCSRDCNSAPNAPRFVRIVK